MLKRLLQALGVLVAALVLAALLWPREPVDLRVDFDPAVIGDDLDAWLAAEESRFDDITPGVEKRILWAGAPGQRTDEVILYIHGFSATSEEVRPVPDNVARALGANLVFWRLAGHGRGGPAMAEPVAGDWIEDMAQAIAVADHLGDRVTVIATSTGGTLAALATTIPELAPRIDRLVMISPNFEIAAPMARLLTWPAVRLWAPLVAGEEVGFTPQNEAQGRYWTTRYPTSATIPMGAMVAAARSADYKAVTTPTLFLFSDADQVVLASATREVAGRWGGAPEVVAVEVGPGDDPFSHVIAGDILSPGMTPVVTDLILDWIARH
jgi:alpha-beta hydrolase superfamily lysophospholipase